MTAAQFQRQYGRSTAKTAPAPTADRQPPPKLRPAHCVPGGPFGPHAGLWQGPISVFVADEPISQPRHRARIIPAQPGQGMRCSCGRHYTASMYLPDGDDKDTEGHRSSKHWKERVAFVGKPMQPATPLAGPLAVCLTFFFHAPEYVLEWAARGKMHLPCLRPNGPDFDNLAKAVCDSMTVAGWWHDDKQIAFPLVPKYWIAHDQSEGVQIDVWHLPQGDEEPAPLFAPAPGVA